MSHCTIFYSWQSDISTTRRFLQNCLNQLPQKLRDIAVIEVERDTKGLAGSPDIIDSIYKKIDRANLFIADITFINPQALGRKIPNPNVLIELGYAIHALGWNKIILLFNKDCGKVEELPFDINHRRITSFSLENKNLQEVKNHLLKCISNTIQILKSENHLDSVSPEIRTAQESLSQILWYGMENAWNYYWNQYIKDEDTFEEEFSVITETDLAKIEIIKTSLIKEHYFALRQIFHKLQKSTVGSEDKNGWEYAVELIEKYVEPLYLKYGSNMVALPLKSIVTKEFIQIFNALSPLESLEYSSEHLWENQIVFLDDGVHQEAYSADHKILCKGELTPDGFTGYREDVNYKGQLIHGKRSGQGDEITNSFLFFPEHISRSGIWKQDEFIGGIIYNVVACKEGDDYFIEDYEKALPITAGCPYLDTFVESFDPGECQNYCLVDMDYQNDQMRIRENSERILCKKMGGVVDLHCRNCWMEE